MRLKISRAFLSLVYFTPDNINNQSYFCCLFNIFSCLLPFLLFSLVSHSVSVCFLILLNSDVNDIMATHTLSGVELIR